MRPGDGVALRSGYRGRRVLVTGHTGFKGSWLTFWLAQLGAEVTGFSLPPDTDPALCTEIRTSEMCRDRVGDVRDRDALESALREAQPEIVFHLAAQSLVRKSYLRPLATLEVNVLGTANLLEAVRKRARPCAVIVVTSDKCYENRGAESPRREDDPVGGHDIYSTSKAAAELVVAGFRRSFFPPDGLGNHGVAVATVRAGNVIGGGDWAPDRIVPDAVRALQSGLPVPVRNPDAVRPWQHVLEPLSGYLQLGLRLADGPDTARMPFCEAWNFGPAPQDHRSVRELLEVFLGFWGEGSWTPQPETRAPHEAARLTLSIEKARVGLGWVPRWGFEEAVARAAHWYRARLESTDPGCLRDRMRREIDDYLGENAESPEASFRAALR
jgi:CDP-glucose 4,6-dehydratase